MKKIISSKLLHHVVCMVLALTVVFQLTIPTIYAASETTASSDEPAVKTASVYSTPSQGENVITEYVNDEDHKHKTIIWAKGITPPKMGGTDSEFIKSPTYVNGKLEYLDYIAPFKPGNGWYDVNKSKDFSQGDFNLCFAAAAANSLHWWMDRNSEYIDKYLQMNPNNEQIQKLNTLRSSFVNQGKSSVYDIFLSQYANKPDGYWSDILQDQFINGYYPKPNGGTNGAPADIDKILNDGPDKRGGFFFDVFKTYRLSDRRYYNNGFDAINRELKELFLNGDSVLLVFTAGARNHVVTLWGVEYDQNGVISAVYYSDSDDEYDRGMMRLKVLNVGGKAIVTTHIDNKGNSSVIGLQVLSLGTDKWKKYVQGPKKTLDLVWSNTEQVYNGKVLAPTVSATNITEGDNINLSIEGGQTNAGIYTATAVLSGPDADKYELPQEHSKQFEIKKAPAPSINYPKASALMYGEKLSDSTLKGGSTEYGKFLWENAETVPTVYNSGYPVKFIPSENALKNYEFPVLSSSTVPVSVSKSTPPVTISSNVEHSATSSTVTFSADLNPVGYGETPTGKISFEVTDENGKLINNTPSNIVIENGKATAVWDNVPNKKYTVKAEYSGNANYNAVTSNVISVDVRKQSQDALYIEQIGEKTYGDSEFELKTTGGSGDGNISFESSDSNIIKITGNTATILKAGNVTITATKSGDKTFNETKTAAQVSVNKKELVVTAENKGDIVQGDSMPEFTYTVDGLVNSDKFTAPTLISSAKDTQTPGDYDIFIEGGTLTNSDSYNITYVKGKFTIKEKELPPVPPTPQPEPKPESKPEAEIESVEQGTEEHKSNSSNAVSSKPAPTPAEQNTQESVSTETSISSSSSEPIESKDNMQSESTESVPIDVPISKEDTVNLSDENYKDNKSLIKIILITLGGVVSAAIAIVAITIPVLRKKKHTK